MSKPPFKYRWHLKDGYPAYNIDNHGLKIYTTFSGGGGSSMGYKLAGYDVIGANDIDPRMAEVYKKNHKPGFYDLCPIGDLLNRDLPREYYNLDILDGSPPCSTFSIAGSREKAFKRNKVFREGQAKQVLSDLFFDWIELVNKLKPKIAIAENVKGMLVGNAKSYTAEILRMLDKAGYKVQLFLLNGASMGLPQVRERVFFLCTRKDLNMPELKMRFNERPITFREVTRLATDSDKTKPLSKMYLDYWRKAKPGEVVGKFGTYRKLSLNEVCYTIPASNNHFHPVEPRELSVQELCMVGLPI